MKNILIIGAGRSSANLIKYLLEHSPLFDWQLRVGDMDISFATSKIGGSKHGVAFKLDASDVVQRRSEIERADLVISMLPASMHMEVAKDCIEFGKNVITPSYIPDEMWQLDGVAKEKGIVILNEMGVDPGIDHMSAMKIIDRYLIGLRGANLCAQVSSHCRRNEHHNRRQLHFIYNSVFIVKPFPFLKLFVQVDFHILLLHTDSWFRILRNLLLKEVRFTF
jgi:hypothetical protein